MSQDDHFIRTATFLVFAALPSTLVREFIATVQPRTGPKLFPAIHCFQTVRLEVTLFIKPAVCCTKKRHVGAINGY